MRLWFCVIGAFIVACGNQDQSVSNDTVRPDTETTSNVYHSESELNTDTVKYVNYSEEVLVKDLNGDGFPEVISRVAEPKTNRIGIRVLDGKEPDRFTVFGAGNEVDGQTNLLWIGSMKVIPAGETIAPTLVDENSGNILGFDTANLVVLQNPAILFLAKNSRGGGILHWTGTDYAWMHVE